MQAKIVNEAQKQTETRLQRSTIIFRTVSYFQTAVFVTVFIFAYIDMIHITKGGAYGIGALVFFVLFLPSLLLLIPDILLIIYTQRLSKAGQFFGYFFHSAALSWSFFLFKTILEN